MKRDNLAKKIKVVLTDVDGVLTDGGMYYNSQGDNMKKFHVRDGMGVTLLRKNGIPTIIVTKEKSKIVKKWASKMKVKKVFDGITEKEKIFEKICKNCHVKPIEIAYLGDDINDIELMKKVGLAAAPHDAIKEVVRYSNYICKTRGGEGVLREIADLILSSKPSSKRLYYKK